MAINIGESTRKVWQGLLPKAETQALDFVVNNPTWDGRGVVVGILDTGVDPGAIGLSVTSHGEPKIIDIIDCSGSGDVKMSQLQTPSQDGYLTGFGGRRLLLNPHWQNPTGQYRVGFKFAFELYSKDLKRRVLEERKKNWTKENRQLEDALQAQLLTAAGECAEDIKNRIAYIRSQESAFDDPGPVLDCLVFHDGERYQAAVDVTETGDFSSLEPMTDYAVGRQYRRLSDFDALNYCCNIYDGGSILSIVTDAGAHGTHVAGIVGAYHADQPECNGVAPGCQIVSLKIGDTRLGSMETGVGLIRGLISAVKCGCHIINMSYGEATAWDNFGAFVQLAEEIVYKHNIIFVASAGNNGPGLSTVGCPGGTSSCCIAVGAYVTHSLMSAAYAMHSTAVESNYTWSSVGPCIDGDLGVAIIAPGGAVTAVPNWTLKKKQLMNGTSMSSPNAAGCIALVVSAAKANNVPFTPTRIRRSIEQSAKYCEEVSVLGQGYGLIQVDAAWNYLSSIADHSTADLPISVKVNSERFSRGIYLRQQAETDTATNFQVTLAPLFRDDHTADFQFQFEMRLKLVASASWIKCPQNVLLLQDGKTFNVFVDPRSLPPGLHVEFIYVMNEALPANRAQILKIPVTITKPDVIPSGQLSLDLGGRLALSSGDRYRRFVAPPHGCTFVDIHIKDLRRKGCGNIAVADEGAGDSIPSGVSAAAMEQQDSAPRTIALHALQLYPGTPYRDNEHDKYATLQPGSDFVTSWAVNEDVTMEIVLAPLWNSIGLCEFSAVLYFRGVEPVPRTITLIGGERVSEMIRIRSILDGADISPSAKLDKWITCIKPSSPGKVSPLGSRDILPSGTRIYETVLEYEADLSEDGDVAPKWPGLQGVLYESTFMAQLYSIFDSKKKLAGVGDAFTSPTKLSKGKYTIRLQVRNTSITVLESLLDMCMLLERPLPKAIPLAFYKMKSDCLAGVNKQGVRAIAAGSSVSMYIKEPTASQLPKNAAPGDILTGSYTCLKANSSNLGSGTKPGGFPIRYLVADVKTSNGTKDKVSNGSGAAVSAKVEVVDELRALESAIKDAELKYAKSLIGKPSFRQIYDQLSDKYPNDIQFLQVSVADISKRREQLAKPIVKDCNALYALYGDICMTNSHILSVIDELQMAAVFGANVDKDNAAAVALKKDMDAKKSAMIEAQLQRALIAVMLLQSTPGDLEAIQGPACITKQQLEAELDECCFFIKKWDDLSAANYWQLNLMKLKLKSYWGTALKLVNDLIDGDKISSKDQLFKEREQLVAEIGANHIYAHICKWNSLSNCDISTRFI